jgi:hypothetical protein
MKGKTHQNLKAGVWQKPSNGEMVLAELSKTGKKGKGGKAVNKGRERDSGDGGGRLQPLLRVRE